MSSEPPGASSQQSAGGTGEFVHGSEAKQLQATPVATFTNAHTMIVAPSPPRASYGTIAATSCAGGDSSVGSSTVGAKSSRSSNGSHRRVNSLPPLKEPVRSTCQRFILLILVSMLPFGGHFVKNCLSSLEVYMIEDRRLGMTETKYGLLVSMSSLPNFIVPFLGGVFLDKRGHRFATLVFLFLILVGQVVFTIAMQLGVYELGLLGRLIVGLGEGSVLVAQRASIAECFKQEEVTFAIGVSVATACIAKTLSRASVVPVSDAMGSYIAGLWYTCAMCLFSTLAGVIFMIVTDEREDPFEKQGLRPPRSPSSLDTSESSHIPTMGSMMSAPQTMRSMTPQFWALTWLHAIYINVFHMFLNFSSHYFTVKYHRSPKNAAFVTSAASVLVIFLGPVVGFVLDRIGGQIYICFACSFLVIFAYYLLAFTMLEPLVSIVMLSVSESFIPIVVMALIPSTIDNTQYGTAYGIVEVTGSISSFIGNIAMGWTIEATGGYLSAILGLIALSVIGSLLFFLLLIGECRKSGDQPKLNAARGALDYEALAAVDE